MAIPTEALRAHLTALEGLEGVSVIRGPISQLVPPALVLRATTPWIEPSNYCHDDQQYVAVAVVTASTPEAGEQQLYTIGLRVMDNLPVGWSFEGMDSPVVDESTGVAFLAAPIRLKYRNNDLEEES